MGIFDFIYQRRDDMMSWAKSMDMTFFESDQYGLKNQLREFDLMNEGYRSKAKNIMIRGHELDNVQECIFDFYYTEGSGEDSRTYETTTIFLNSKGLLLPQFFMRPKNRLGKWFQRIRKKNQGPSDKDQLLYNYKVSVEDESQIDFLVASGIHTLLIAENIYHLEGNQHYLLIYSKDNLLSINQIMNMRTTAHGIYDYLKANSWYV